jgi:hypothetical protein
VNFLGRTIGKAEAITMVRSGGLQIPSNGALGFPILVSYRRRLSIRTSGAKLSCSRTFLILLFLSSAQQIFIHDLSHPSGRVFIGDCHTPLLTNRDHALQRDDPKHIDHISSNSIE